MTDTQRPALHTVPSGDTKKGYLHGLDLLRVIASSLVVYTHVANWFSTRGHSWWASMWMDRDVIGPLHLNPALSFAGVATFLVVSGLVVTKVADRESSGQFLRRRLTRIVPLLLLSSFAAWLMINLDAFPSESKQSSVDGLDLLLGATMSGFFTTPEVVLNGVTWTLLIQVFFYLLVAAAIPLLRRRAWIPPAVFALLSGLALALGSLGGTVGAHRVAIIGAFFPVLCIGQLISLVRSGKVHSAAGIAIGAVHFLIFLWAGRVGGFFHTGDSHPRTLLLVIALVLLAMTVSGRVSRSAVVKGWSSRTYAIYLLHPLCIYPLMDLLVPNIPQDLALLASLLTLVLTTELVHRFFEMPINRWFRAREKRESAPPVTRTSGNDRVAAPPPASRR